MDENTQGGSSPHNLLLRREAPYPLGHTSYDVLALWLAMMQTRWQTAETLRATSNLYLNPQHLHLHSFRAPGCSSRADARATIEAFHAADKGWPPPLASPSQRKSCPVEQPDMAGEDLAPYADPSYWLYGLLSFCAEICAAKTTEAGGQPNFRTSKERKKEGTARNMVLEAVHFQATLYLDPWMPCSGAIESSHSLYHHRTI